MDFVNPLGQIKIKLCDNIILKQNGQLKVKRKITTNLKEQLCIVTKSENYDEVYAKIRKEARVKIRLQNCFYKEVFSVNKSFVREWTKWLRLKSVPGLYSDLDLDKGKYEGGFKVWESTSDLIKFVTRDCSLVMNDILYNYNHLNVLELGAGAALPSLALLSRLVGDEKFSKPYQIHIQDYNWQVLTSLTLLNFAVNFPIEYVEALLKTKCLRFFHGDWSNFAGTSTTLYDLIIMSEVIYNFDNYESLHRLLEEFLDEHGYILLATKDTYFGLSGSIYSWLDYVNSRGTFHLHKHIKNSTKNIPRSLLVFKRSNQPTF